MSKSKDKIAKAYVTGSTILSVGIGVAIIISLSVQSWPGLVADGFSLWGTEWNPSENIYGVFPMIFGTLAVTFIAVLLAVPIGVQTAIFISETLPKRLHFLFKSFLELLAGIPSIIYGLIGVAFLNIWVADIFDLQTGRTILTAGVLLAVMILPTIITLTDNSLRQIPDSFREHAVGLGMYPNEVIRKTLIPIAKPQILGSVLLALGRAMGETMAVMLIIGSMDKLPAPIYNWLQPGQTITSKLGREVAETSFGSIHFDVMIGMGLILLLLVLGLTWAGQKIYKTDLQHD